MNEKDPSESVQDRNPSGEGEPYPQGKKKKNRHEVQLYNCLTDSLVCFTYISVLHLLPANFIF